MSSVLQTARAKAAKADFPALLSLCQQLRTDPAITLEQLLDVGNLLAQFGFLSEAEGCYRQGLSLVPNDLRPGSISST